MHAAAIRGRALARIVERFREDWLERIAETWTYATARRVVEILPASPVLDANRAAELTGASTVSTRKALTRLQELGAVRLLRHDTRRARVWVADEMLGMLNAFEWDLTSASSCEELIAGRFGRYSVLMVNRGLSGQMTERRTNG
jgi:hypothetical protein